MKLQEIVVRFKGDDGNWEEKERYIIDPNRKKAEENILHKKSPLVIAARGMQENQVGKVATGQTFLLVEKIYKHDIGFYLENLGKVKNYNDNRLIDIGNQLPELLNKALSKNNKRRKLVDLIVSAKLNQEEVEECIYWLEQIGMKGEFVDDIIGKLNLISASRKGLKIENITHVYTLNQISKWYVELQAYTKAKRILNRSLDLDQMNSVTLTQLGKLSRLTKHYQEGIAYYTKALQIEKNVYSYNGLGGIYRDQKRFHKAEECYWNSLDLIEGNSFAHKGLGAVYYELDQHDQGDFHFLQAEFDERLMFKMVHDADKEGDIEKSVKLLRLILVFDESHKSAKKMLARNLKTK